MNEPVSVCTGLQYMAYDFHANAPWCICIMVELIAATNQQWRG